MSDFVWILGFAFLWVVIQVFVLPRLGVPT